MISNEHHVKHIYTAHRMQSQIVWCTKSLEISKLVEILISMSVPNGVHLCNLTV